MAAPDGRDKAKVVALRAVAGPSLNAVSDAALWEVVCRCDGDLDLACTALSMIPRPWWVAELVGQ